MIWPKVELFGVAKTNKNINEFLKEIKNES